MQEFSSIENIYNNLSSLKPGIRDILIKGEKEIPLTRELVTIVTDYSKISLSEEMLYRKQIFVNEIYNVLEELELNSLFNVMNYSLFHDKLTINC